LGESTRKRTSAEARVTKEEKSKSTKKLKNQSTCTRSMAAEADGSR